MSMCQADQVSNVSAMYHVSSWCLLEDWFVASMVLPHES